jgi:hypothetical protein
MRKGSGTKVRVSLTLNKGLMDQITATCDRRLMKISNYIEKLITIGLKNEKLR